METKVEVWSPTAHESPYCSETVSLHPVIGEFECLVKSAGNQMVKKHCHHKQCTYKIMRLI